MTFSILQRTSQTLRRMPRRRPAPRRGLVLLLVLVVIVILALSAYTFSDMMLTHYEAVEHNGRQVQARALVDSGLETVRMFLLQDKTTRAEAGGVYDNPAFFQALPVAYDDVSPEHTGSVTILAPTLDDDGRMAGVRYGLEDESARINLNALVALFDNPASAALMQGAQQAGAGGGTNVGGLAGTGGGGSTATSSISGNASAGLASTATAGEEEEVVATPSPARDLLMTLPGMTEDVADAILDWIDEDDEPRDFGAESEYYTTLDPPYAPRNGPLVSVEELLLVRGVTPALLFGHDQNRNGAIDPHEMQSTSTADNLGVLSADAALGSLDRGWSAYFTLHSMESNTNAYGEPRIDLNGEDLQALHDQLTLALGEQQATFIVAYRLSGAYTGTEAGETTIGQLDLGAQGGTRITSVLELIDTKVQVQFVGSDEPTVLAPAFPLVSAESFLPNLMDNVTINPAATIPGRININRAPRSVLLGIPGMSEEIVEGILSARAGVDPAATDDPNWQHETWPLVQGIVTLDEMKLLAPFVTAGGDVYRAQVVGYFLDGQASARSEVIVDATGELPRVVFWRDISHLGRGYPLDILGTGAAPIY